MKKITYKAVAGAMSLMLAVSSVGLNSVIEFTAFADDVVSYSANDMLALPEVRPTASRAFTNDSIYTVPVYMYAKLVDGASMGNGALEHEATIALKSGVATVTLKFHPMSLGDDDDVEGHLEKFYYYDSNNNRTEVTNCKYDYCVDSSNTNNRIKYITECTFELPTAESDVTCRVKVDAMGDTEQDAVLVFDYNNTKNNMIPYAEQKIAEAEAISNDDGRYTDESYAALRAAIATAKTNLTAKAEQSLSAEYNI